LIPKEKNTLLIGNQKEKVLQWLFQQSAVSSEQGVLELPTWRSQDKQQYTF